MRPLCRWTIGGNISQLGWEIFSESIRVTPKVYPEFDFVICYNNLSQKQLRYLQITGLRLFDQSCSESCVPYHPWGEGCEDFHWKLVPPRLRIESHELWLDNDLLIRDRIDAIDQWLRCHTGIISVGFDSLYGRFQDRVKADCCAGFFGLPPFFDFKARIRECCGDQPLRRYDEQGLVAYIVTNMPGWILVPYNDLRMWGIWQKEFGDLPSGIHFVRANSVEQMGSWDFYRLTTSP